MTFKNCLRCTEWIVGHEIVDISLFFRSCECTCVQIFIVNFAISTAGRIWYWWFFPLLNDLHHIIKTLIGWLANWVINYIFYGYLLTFLCNRKIKRNAMRIDNIVSIVLNLLTKTALTLQKNKGAYQNESLKASSTSTILSSMLLFGCNYFVRAAYVLYCCWITANYWKKDMRNIITVGENLAYYPQGATRPHDCAARMGGRWTIAIVPCLVGRKTFSHQPNVYGSCVCHCPPIVHFNVY